MRFTDMADEMFGAAQGALPAGVRLATAKRGGVTITRVEIAREGLAKPRGRYVTLEMPSVSVLDERDAAVIEGKINIGIAMTSSSLIIRRNPPFFLFSSIL